MKISDRRISTGLRASSAARATGSSDFAAADAGLGSGISAFAIPDWFWLGPTNLDGFAHQVYCRFFYHRTLQASSGRYYHVYPWLLTVCEMIASTGFVLILLEYPNPDFRVHTFWASLLVWAFALVHNIWIYVVFAFIYTGVIFLGMAGYFLPLNPSQISAALYIMTLTIGLAACPPIG